MIEQDHRGIKERYGPMRGFNSFKSAERFCRAFDELKNFNKIIRRAKYEENTCRKKEEGRRKNYIEKTEILNKLLLNVA